MKTRAVRLYGSNQLSLDTFDLPALKDDEILVKVISDSICMSTYKATTLGTKHKRVPNDASDNPVIIGHEFSGIIKEVGKQWADQFSPGQRFAIQPALNYKGSMDSPGYSYRHVGGDMTYAIIPPEVMELGCLIKYEGDSFFEASLAEPMSCVIGAFHATYHTVPNTYEHVMDIKEGGSIAILGGAGPMGLAAIEYVIHRDRKPSLLVVSDVSDERLERAASVISKAEAFTYGVTLHYVNPNHHDDFEAYMKSLNEGAGYDDVLVFAPIKPLVEQGDRLLGKDGTLNFFAGPTDANFSAELNLYNVHYASTKVMGSTGGNTDDMIESLELTAAKRIQPGLMITHIGGLDSVVDTVLNYPKIPGGKKMIYVHHEMPLTPIAELASIAHLDPKYKVLGDIVKAHNNLWTKEAEDYLLKEIIQDPDVA